MAVVIQAVGNASFSEALRAAASVAAATAAPLALVAVTDAATLAARARGAFTRAVDVAALRNYFSKHNTVQGESFFDRVNNFLFYVMV